MAFTLAHFSDPHLGPLPSANWRDLANKRLSGFFSWNSNRVKIHKPAVLKLLVDDMKAHKPDHIAITGDLINISLSEEFKAAAHWLEGIGSPDRVTVIPGNHDAYVRMPWDEFLAHWAEYMRGKRDDATTETLPTTYDDFPFTRIFGDIAIIGTSTATPMPPFIAAGRLGDQQLKSLESVLKKLGKQGLFRIILIHHPPFAGGAYKRKSLLDAHAFQAVINNVGAELVLHGHTHVSGLNRLATPNGLIPVIGVPSASAIAAGHKDSSRYHLYRIERYDDSWRLNVDIRGLNANQNAFEDQGNISMSIPLSLPSNTDVDGVAA